MTNEQKEAIDRLKDDIKYADMRDTVDDDCTICFIDDLDTVLSLLEQKDKQIDLMAKYWNTGLAMCDNCDKIVEKYEKNNCKNCIKQYFADLVEKE